MTTQDGYGTEDPPFPRGVGGFLPRDFANSAEVVNRTVPMTPNPNPNFGPIPNRPSPLQRQRFVQFPLFDGTGNVGFPNNWNLNALFKTQWLTRQQAPMAFRVGQAAGRTPGPNANPFLEAARVRGIGNLSVFSETRQFFERALDTQVGILRNWNIIHDPAQVDQLAVAKVAVPAAAANQIDLDTYLEQLSDLVILLIETNLARGFPAGRWSISVNSRWRDPNLQFVNGTRLCRPINIPLGLGPGQVTARVRDRILNENDSMLLTMQHMELAPSGWVWAGANWVNITKVDIGTNFGVAQPAGDAGLQFPFPQFQARDNQWAPFLPGANPLPVEGYIPGAAHLPLPEPWTSRRSSSSPFLNTLNFDDKCFKYAVTAAISGNHTVHPDHFSSKDFDCVTWPDNFPFPTPLSHDLIDALEDLNHHHRFSVFVIDPAPPGQVDRGMKKAAWNFRHVPNGEQTWCQHDPPDAGEVDSVDHWLVYYQSRHLPPAPLVSVVPVAKSHWMLVINRRMFLNQVTRGHAAGSKTTAPSSFCQACDVCLETFCSQKAFDHHSETCRGGTRIVLPLPGKNGASPLLVPKPNADPPEYFAAFDFECYDQPTAFVESQSQSQDSGPETTVLSKQIPSAFCFRVVSTSTGKCVFREDYPYLHPDTGDPLPYTHHEKGVNEDYDFDQEEPKYRIAKRLIRAALCARGRLKRPPDPITGKISDTWILQCYSHGGMRYDSLIVLKAAAVAKTVNISVLPRNGTSMLQVRIGKVMFLGFENFLHSSLAAGVDSMNLRGPRTGECILDFEQRRMDMASVTYAEFKDEIVARDTAHPGTGWSNVFAKGIFPYDLCMDASFFKRTRVFPPPEAFVGKLTKSAPSDEVYALNKAIFEKECRSDMLVYMMRYCALDTSLLCDLINYFRKNARRDFDVEMLRYLTSPAMYWDASLRRIPVRGLELLTDENMYLFWRRGIVGGFAGRLGDVDCISNFPELDTMREPGAYHPQKEPSLQFMLDMNSMYADALAHTAMPYADFVTVPGDQFSLEAWTRIICDYSTTTAFGFLLEVDIHCPHASQDSLVDLIPLLPGHHITRKEDLDPRQLGYDTVKPRDHSKLVVHFFDKIQACHHILQLKHAICDHGYVLTRVHKACRFKQATLYTDYVNDNIARRKVAESDLQSNECKAANNYVYGFSAKNPYRGSCIQARWFSF